MTPLAWSRRAPLLAALALGVRLVGCGGGSSDGSPSAGAQASGGRAGSGGGLGASGATSAGGTSNASGGLGGTGGGAAGGVGGSGATATGGASGAAATGGKASGGTASAAGGIGGTSSPAGGIGGVSGATATGGNGGLTGAGGASSGMAGVSGGGCAGVGNGSVPPPTCNLQTGAITYSTLDECGHVVTSMHNCPSGCVFASTGSVKCQDEIGTPPFRTCLVASDCATEQHCADSTTLQLLDSPTCNEGMCDWQTSGTEHCVIGCPGGACSNGYGGSTSGGFQWWATPATCDGKTITGSTTSNSGTGGGGNPFTHVCQNACFTDTTGVGCDLAPGEPPLHTCVSSSDCPDTVSQCVAGDSTTATIWSQPFCQQVECFWTVTETVPCASGTTCQTSSCQ